MLTYRVTTDGSGWMIQCGSAQYTGYRSELSARKAAVAVAKRVALGGQDVEVLVAAPDRRPKTIWPLDPGGVGALLMSG